MSFRGWIACFVTLHWVLINLNVHVIMEDYFAPFLPRSLNEIDYLASLVCAVVPSTVLPRSSSPAATAGWIIYLFAYLSAAIVGVSVLPTLADYFYFIFFFASGLAVFTITAHLRLRCPAPKVCLKNLDIAIMMVVLASALYIWRLADYSIRAGLEDVYVRRLGVRDAQGVGGYVSAVLRLLLPILAVYSWHMRRNLLWPCALLFGCVVIFSYDGTKIALLLPAILWLMMIGITRANMPSLILVFIQGFLIMSIVEHWLSDSSVIAHFGIRRAFVEPGMISAMYWDYSSQVTNVNNITYDIGYYYFGNEHNNANSGFLMWGYIWMGWIGGTSVAVMGGLIVSTFLLMPGPRFPWMGSLMAGGCALIWCEQFLHTSLLSSGVLYVLIAALLMRIASPGFPTMKPNRLLLLGFRSGGRV